MRDDEDLRFQIENSPFSEDFIVYAPEGESAIRGLFDESVMADEKQQSTRVVPRITVVDFPQDTAEIVIRVRGKDYHVNKRDVDANIGIVVWLY
jgi:hypothetical protein